MPESPKGPEDYALKEIDVTWRDGGAYALLGPSGCGKSTLLNIISGLLTPSEGQILFDDRDVTALPPDQRNIAQVFQFPVIYDTMTVGENLAFPLKNRGVDPATIKRRVDAIAEMLDVTDMLNIRASGLSPDNKQKISMGRGLVRDDVNAVMFDEPLTVIDPHLKWKLRSKLKELHQRVKATMIYVTHDQTEALTFADEVVVMQEGEVVQIGTPGRIVRTPAAHFRGPFHRLAGHERSALRGAKATGPCSKGTKSCWKVPFTGDGGRTDLGIRPEYVGFGETGIPARVTKVSDIGRHFVVSAMVGNTTALKAVTNTTYPSRDHRFSCNSNPNNPASTATAGSQPRSGANENRKPKSVVLCPARAGTGRVQRAGADDDGGQLFGAGNLWQQPVFLGRPWLVRTDPAIRPVSGRAWAAVPVHLPDPDHRGAAGHHRGPFDAAQRVLGAGLSGD